MRNGFINRSDCRGLWQKLIKLLRWLFASNLFLATKVHGRARDGRLPGWIPCPSTRYRTAYSSGRHPWEWASVFNFQQGGQKCVTWEEKVEVLVRSNWEMSTGVERVNAQIQEYDSWGQAHSKITVSIDPYLCPPPQCHSRC